MHFRPPGMPTRLPHMPARVIVVRMIPFAVTGHRVSVLAACRTARAAKLPHAVTPGPVVCAERR